MEGSKASTSSGAMRALSIELKNLQSQPVEGFTIDVNEDNMFVWSVGIYGPPKTLYQGGYFKASIRFPSNYPYSPPSMKFTTKVWHPNVYEVCLAFPGCPSGISVFFRTEISALASSMPQSTTHRVESWPARDGIRLRASEPFFCRSSRCSTSRTHLHQPTWTLRSCTESGRRARMKSMRRL